MASQPGSIAFSNSVLLILGCKLRLASTSRQSASAAMAQDPAARTRCLRNPHALREIVVTISKDRKFCLILDVHIGRDFVPTQTTVLSTLGEHASPKCLQRQQL
eukprot:667563-Amphidinium_carterae.1